MTPGPPKLMGGPGYTVEVLTQAANSGVTQLGVTPHPTSSMLPKARGWDASGGE